MPFGPAFCRRAKIKTHDKRDENADSEDNENEDEQYEDEEEHEEESKEEEEEEADEADCTTLLKKRNRVFIVSSRPKSGRSRTIVRRCKLGRVRAKFGRSCQPGIVGRSRADFSRCRAKLVNFGPNLPAIGQMLAEVGPNSADAGPSLVDVGRNKAEFGRSWAEVVRSRAALGRF